MQDPEELRRHASQLLALAINASDQGQTEVAERLIAQAIQYLDKIGIPPSDEVEEKRGL